VEAAWGCEMLSAAEIADVQAECFAEDIEPPEPVPSWTRDQWIAFFESGGDEQAALEVLQPKQPGGPAQYEVVHTVCFVRAAPSTTAKAVGQLSRGTVVDVARVIDGWAQLADNAEPDSSTSPTGECWMLIDGKSVGLGELLRPLPPQLTPVAIAAALAARTDLVRFMAPVTYEVTAQLLFAHELPDETSRKLGEPLESGARVLVQAKCDGWVQLASDYESLLSYGTAAASAGWLQDVSSAQSTIRVAEKRLPSSTVWQVTRADNCLGYRAPGGLGEGKGVDALVEGARIEVDAECGHWVRLKGVAEVPWVELDIFLAG